MNVDILRNLASEHIIVITTTITTTTTTTITILAVHLPADVPWLVSALHLSTFWFHAERLTKAVELGLVRKELALRV